MNIKHFWLYIFIILFFSGGYLMAQTTEEKSFTDYASNQSNLLHNEYVKRDTKAYRQLLNDLVHKYNKLNENDRAMFRQYIANSYYNLCCAYSLLSDKKNALNYLDSAVNKGYNDYSHLPQDDDLNNIRNEERYKKVSDYLRSQYDYMYILKRAGVYNDNDLRKIPAFTYQSFTDSNLAALRTKFKLDSIAGSGNDVSRAINILHWVHNTVHHDGQHESGIEHINAPEILSTAKAKNIGVSCGELATTLNECYLAMGWK